MKSKERPKKITMIGSDNKKYYFVVKKDNAGDMRKEARVIIAANMVNVMMKSVPETHKKAVQLHTYAITPLSYKTGLVEWVPGTNTVKNIICKL